MRVHTTSSKRDVEKVEMGSVYVYPKPCATQTRDEMDHVIPIARMSQLVPSTPPIRCTETSNKYLVIIVS